MHYITLIALIICSQAWSQKTMNKQWSSSGIEVLQLKSDEVYNIRLYSHEEPVIKTAIYAEGESNESVVLEARNIGDTLRLQTAYSPYFEAYNDKLAAHKVVAIEMTIFVPQDIQIDLEARLASVNTYGRFKELLVQLDQGNGTFENFQGNGRLYTRLGFINLNAVEGVGGQANSVFGKVINKLPESGRFRVEAESRHGNVYLGPSQ